MNISSFVSAFFIGMAISLPLGPVALLTVQRSVKNGFLSGFLTGFGAANGDLVYSLGAGFGVILISDFVHHHELGLALLGACFIGMFGYKIIKDTPKDLHLPGHKNHLMDYTSGILMALINPAIILVYSAILLNIGQIGHISHNHFVIQVVVGIFLGSSFWWAILSYGMSRIKHKLSPHVLSRVNKFSGIIMIGIALLIVIRAIIH